MKKYKKTITAYELADAFTVEVEETEETVDFYITHDAIGIKMFMFGLYNVCPFEEDEIEEIIEANAEQYIDIYTNKYLEGDEQ